MKLVYIHGFRGDPLSPKVLYLRQEFPQYETVSFPVDPRAHVAYAQIDSVLSALLKEDDDIVLVGTSLGGFWAHFFADKYALKAILMNPTYKPQDTLQRYINGLDWFHENCEEYAHYPLKFKAVYPKIVLLETGDNILSPGKTQWKYQKLADVRVYEGGNHRFTNMEALQHAVFDIANANVEHLND